ncbi:MAG: NADH-quinone oxidoreductase subunit C [Candidatus Bathyarchaeia archaeon]
MEAVTREVSLVEELRKSFPEVVLEAKVQRKYRVEVKVMREGLVEVASFLKESLGFDYAVSVTGVDYPARNEFEVIYHVWSISGKILLALKTAVPKDQPRIDTLSQVWESANLHERETYEMLGLEFEGHPNLKGLLLPEGWDKGYPLRKDFKLPTGPQG